MTLITKILTILKESEEEDLFKPRKIEDRERKFNQYLQDAINELGGLERYNFALTRHKTIDSYYICYFLLVPINKLHDKLIEIDESFDEYEEIIAKGKLVNNKYLLDKYLEKNGSYIIDFKRLHEFSINIKKNELEWIL